MGRAAGGLAVAYSKKMYNNKIIYSDPQCISFSFDFLSYTLFIITIYFNPSSNMAKNIEILELVCESIYSAHPDAIVVIGGDFNCRIGNKNYIDLKYFDVPFDSVRFSRDNTKSANCDTLIDYMNSPGLIVLYGRSPGDSPASFTYVSSKGRSVIDLVWASLSALDLCMDVRVKYLNTGSDHFPVELILYHPGAGTALPSPDPSVNRLKWRGARGLRYMEGMQQRERKLTWLRCLLPT